MARPTMFTDDESGFYDSETYKAYVEEILEVILDTGRVTIADIHRLVKVVYREWTLHALKDILSTGLIIEHGYRHYSPNHRAPLEMPTHSMMPSTVDHTLPVNAYTGRKD